jgi:hypothetical protein
VLLCLGNQFSLLGRGNGTTTRAGCLRSERRRRFLVHCAQQKELVIIIVGERGTPQLTLTAEEAMIDGALMPRD